MQFIPKDAVDVCGDERPSVFQVLEFIQRTDSVWRPCPDSVKHGVEKYASL